MTDKALICVFIHLTYKNEQIYVISQEKRKKSTNTHTEHHHPSNDHIILCTCDFIRAEKLNALSVWPKKEKQIQILNNGRIA